jgi:hypothetical protein
MRPVLLRKDGRAKKMGIPFFKGKSPEGLEFFDSGIFLQEAFMCQLSRLCCVK